MARIDPDIYIKYITTYDKGHNIMYAECLKDLYGTLDTALIFWVELINDLERWGFKINRYDWCIMNKYIEGDQCTIMWHVDDIKTSHRYPKVVTTIIDLISSFYGRESPLIITRGKVHEYLGMTIDFSEKGKGKFIIYDYISDMLEYLPEDTKTGESETPAEYHLFTTI